MNLKYGPEITESQLSELRKLSKPFHRKRVKVVRMLENEGLSVEEYEHAKKVGKEGLADALNFDGTEAETVSVLLDDGSRLRCLPGELEICSNEPIPLRDESCRNGEKASDVANTRYVQSCVAHVGFPRNAAEFHAVLDTDSETDMENILWPDASRTGVGWNTPRWMTAGDILFFYHTKTAAINIDRLVRSASEDSNDEWSKIPDSDFVKERLCEQYDIAQRMAGTIFGCALVTGDAALENRAREKKNQLRHFKGRIFAPISREFAFARPIPDYAFQEIVKVSPGGALTPLHGTAFADLKALIQKHNDIPDFLLSARAGGASFRDISETNWIDIACSPAVRFIDESQLRSYLVDYLLEAVKDPKTHVLQECRCGHTDRHPTFADYCVQIGSRWISVETKLNIKAEEDLRRQVTSYLDVNEFRPTRGNRSGTSFFGPTASICLVVDSKGIYILDQDGFVSCGVDRPAWELKNLTYSTLPEIREKVQFISLSAVARAASPRR